MDWHRFVLRRLNSAPKHGANPLYCGTVLEQLLSQIARVNDDLYIYVIEQVIERAAEGHV